MPKSGFLISKQTLKSLYLKKKLTTYVIAKHFGCSPASIQRLLKKYKIKTRSASEAKRLSANIQIPKSKLIMFYNNQQLNGAEIGKIFICSKAKIYNRLLQYKIKIRKKSWTRPSKKPKKRSRITIPEKCLKKLYLEKNLTIEEIAKLFNCSTTPVLKQLKKQNIKSNSVANRAKQKRIRQIPALKLKKLYLKQGFSTRRLAKLFRCSQTRIIKRMEECQIKLRSNADSHINYPRHNFSGNLIEKSYLIGFRIGDLRVRKQYQNSKTVNVDCGSTKPAQIKLIKNLFKDYGHVWISKPNKKEAVQIEAFLNESFSFLLKDWQEIPLWIKNKEECFWPFLAGFTDADGCISLGKGQAYYSLGNYKKTILKQIRKFLIEQKFFCPKLVLGYKKGWIDKQGFKRKGDYWTLRLTRKKDLLRLFDKLTLHLKHPQKILAVEKARENIFQRNERFGYRNMD